MSKFGYVCKCGWKLSRVGKTRKQYAKAKELHAWGDLDNPNSKPCKYLADELKRTSKNPGA